MKKILSLLIALFLVNTFVFAADNNSDTDSYGDDYDDGFVYEMNGAGDQFLKVNIGGIFPLNFNKQLYIGGAIEIGYYKLLSKTFGIGGEFGASYNVSIGKKMMVLIPVTGGIVYQPFVGKFEFPMTLNIGFGYETFQNLNYFPSLVVKANEGVYFRITEVCSIGINSSQLWIPQWTKEGFNQGIFATASISARYHF